MRPSTTSIDYATLRDIIDDPCEAPERRTAAEQEIARRFMAEKKQREEDKKKKEEHDKAKTG